MIGFIGILAWAVVGIIVAGVDRRSNEGSEVTVVCVIGAIGGAFVGRTVGFYMAFGEIIGFVCAAVGAMLLLSLYRSQTVGMRVRGDLPQPEPVLPVPTVAAAEPREPRIGMLLLEAFAWGVMCAVATAVVGEIGHTVGWRLYPQRYEQIPSDFLFIPLGLLVGFIAAGVGRLAAREWDFPGMFALVMLVSLAYGGLMFQYARGHAIPANFTASIDPNPTDAVTCDRDCDSPDPPQLQWTVQGYLRVKETTGMGGNVDDIEIFSRTYDSGPVKPQPYSREREAEATRWRGAVTWLTGRDIPGPRRIGPNEEAVYPIRHSYRTQTGGSRRQVIVTVHLTDRAGKKTSTYLVWKVW